MCDPRSMLEWAQPLFYLVGVISAVAAVWRYFRASKQRTAETLIELEDRFERHRAIRRMIDPPANESEPVLLAVRKTLGGVERNADERELLMQLDEFLRFLLLLSRLQLNELVSCEALAYMYYYWFNTVRETPELWQYVQRYFPTLRSFMEDYQDAFSQFAPQMKS